MQFVDENDKMLENWQKNWSASSLRDDLLMGQRDQRSVWKSDERAAPSPHIIWEIDKQNM